MTRYIKAAYRRLVISHYVMGLLGMLAPGVLLAAFPTHWTTTTTLESSFHAPVGSVVLLGIVVAFASLFATFSKKYRDFGLVVGAIFYLIITAAYIVAFIQGVTIGVLVLVIPVLAWLYIERATDTSSEVIKNERSPETKED